jgi:L-rhamnose mutarotase
MDVNNNNKSNNNLIRKAFVMNVYPDRQDEYKTRHDEIWPELEELLKAHGAYKYSIFLHHESSQLFAYLEITDEEKWNDLAKTDICRKWWKYMSDIMKSNPDDSPVLEELHEVFRLS